jgi:hypothetical protein
VAFSTRTVSEKGLVVSPSPSSGVEQPAAPSAVTRVVTAATLNIPVLMDIIVLLFTFETQPGSPGLSAFTL